MNKSDRETFNLFILQFYFSETAEAKGNERNLYDFIDSYNYYYFLDAPNIRAIMACFPENERCFYTNWGSYNCIKE